MRQSARSSFGRICCFLLVAWLAATTDARADSAWSERADPAFRQVVSGTLSFVTMGQDATGFIWLGTQSGLLRWDGYKLRSYLSDVSVPGTLPDSFIQSLYTDQAGRFWVGTSAGGLVRYDAEQDRFVSPLAKDATLSRHSVFAMVDDGPHGLWVATGGGLDRLDIQTGVVQRHASFAGPQGLPDRPAHAVVADAVGVLWVGTDRGLFRRASEKDRFEPVALATAESTPPDVRKLLLDSDGRLWVGTRSSGIFVVDKGAAEAVALRGLVKEPLDHDTDVVFALIQAAPSEVWIGTESGGILRVDTRQWTARREKHIEGVASSLRDNDIYALLRDRRGMVWVGSDSAFSVHDPRQEAVMNWMPSGRGGISHMNVPCVLALPDGRVWLATGDGGVDIVDPARGKVGRLSPNAQSPQTALPPGRVLSMSLAPSGEIYLGTQHGLYRADASGAAVRRLEAPGRSAVQAVWAMAWQESRLWIGGSDGLWMTQPQPTTTTLTPLLREDGNRLPDHRISALLPGPDGAMWVGTRSGLARLQPRDMSVSRLPPEQVGRIGVPGGFISSLVYDRQGRLWIGAFGAGVRVVTWTIGNAEPAIRRITAAEGLPHNGVNMVLIDQAGVAWASTDKGLARIDGQTLQAHAIGAEQGLGIQMYWTNSGAVTADGEVLFGGMGGLAIVDPSRPMTESSYVAPVVVTELRVGDERPVMSYPLVRAPPQPLAISPARRSVLVEFAALDFAAPERNRYEHRLRGIDDEWRAIDASRRVAMYTNLPVGRHTLELRAAGPSGPWSPTLQIPLDVEPAWHETTWFKGALAVIVCATLAALVHTRTMYLRRRQLVLRALVDERTQQLLESQRQLEKIAYFDGLTGLANRRLFNDELRRLLAQSQRTGTAFALLLIDLDHFKQVNDTQGHDAGDALLVAVALRLQAAVRETDRVARLGGDEFAVLLHNLDDDADVATVCERIFAAFAQPVEHNAQRLKPQGSIGAALCPRHGQAPEALYKAADMALYAAKRAGRNRWQMYAGTKIDMPAQTASL